VSYRFFFLKHPLKDVSIALFTIIGNHFTEALSGLVRLLLEHVPEPIQFRIYVGGQGQDKCCPARTISVLHGVRGVHHTLHIFETVTQWVGPLQELRKALVLSAAGTARLREESVVLPYHMEELYELQEALVTPFTLFSASAALSFHGRTFKPAALE
jgi:hypothetical protein